jgi:hypothetical protein
MYAPPPITGKIVKSAPSITVGDKVKEKVLVSSVLIR